MREIAVGQDTLAQCLRKGMEEEEEEEGYGAVAGGLQHLTCRLSACFYTPYSLPSSAAPLPQRDDPTPPTTSAQAPSP